MISRLEIIFQGATKIPEKGSGYKIFKDVIFVFVDSPCN